MKQKHDEESLMRLLPGVETVAVAVVGGVQEEREAASWRLPLNLLRTSQWLLGRCEDVPRGWRTR